MENNFLKLEQDSKLENDQIRKNIQSLKEYIDVHLFYEITRSIYRI